MESTKLSSKIIEESQSIIYILELLQNDLSNTEIANNIKKITYKATQLLDSYVAEQAVTVFKKSLKDRFSTVQVYASLFQQAFAESDYRSDLIVQSHLISMKDALRAMIDTLNKSAPATNKSELQTLFANYLADFRFLIEMTAAILGSRPREIPPHLSPKHYREEISIKT